MKLGDEILTLRALEPDDVELVYQWENDVDIWRVSDTRTPISKFLLASYIKTADRDIWESRELRLIIETLDGQPVGTIELFDFEPYHSRAGLGIVIASTESRQKGYATHACDLIERYAAEILGIYQLYVNIAASNEVSLRFFEKRNYLNGGRKLHWIRTSKGWEDELMFQKFL